MNSKSLSDAILVSNYINGDELALSVLINRHQQRLYSFIFSKVYDRDVTEDVFQDTFIKVIKTLKLGKYNEEGKFLPWVMRIAHNLVIDYFRKNNRMPKFNNSAMAIEAMELMETNEISQLLVQDNGRFVGVVHIHDLIKEGII